MMMLEICEIKNFLIGSLTLSLMVILAASPSLAQGQWYENRKIQEVQIKGNKIINSLAIKNKINTKRGGKLKKSVVIEDVKNLFETSFFNNISVESKKGTKGRVIVIFNIQERPRIDSITYEGHQALSKKKLQELFQLKVYEFLDIQKLKAAILNIQKGYEEKGYFLTQISYQIKEAPQSQKVKIIIKINESKKSLIKKITFVGNKNIADDEIKSYLFNREESIFSFLSGAGIYKEENLKKDIQIIRHLYSEKGYLEAQISRPVVSLSPSKDGIYISYFINEGNMFSVGQMDFKGDLIIPKIELRKSLFLETGDTFVYSRLQKSLKSIQTKYGDKGYAFANIIPLFSQQDSTVHILFQIQKGDKVHVNQIHISGNQLTRDRVIRRMINISEGDLYSASKLTESKNSIRRLGYFEKVDVVNQPLKEDEKKVDLEVSVEEREGFGVFQGGISVNSSSGLGANLEVNKQNFLGLGVTTGLRSQYIPSREAIFSINYVDPYFLDTNWYFGTNIFYFNTIKKDILSRWFSRLGLKFLNIGDDKDSQDSVIKNQETNNQTQQELTKKEKIIRNQYWDSRHQQYLKDSKGVQFTLGRWLTDYIKLNSQLKIEDVEFPLVRDLYIFDVSSTAGFRTMLGGILEYDNRNDRLLPTDGFFISASPSWIYANLDQTESVNKLIQLDFTFRYYKTLIWKLVWKNNFQFGYIRSLNNKEIPFDMLYLLGGAHNLRGFKENTVGPKRRFYNGKIETQDKSLQYPETKQDQFPFIPYGGWMQAFYNLELQIPIVPAARVFGSVFFDIGFANDYHLESFFKSDSKFSFNQGGGLKKSVGFGVLWIAPIGPLNIKWGFPIWPDKQMGESDFEYHFSISSDF